MLDVLEEQRADATVDQEVFDALHCKRVAVGDLQPLRRHAAARVDGLRGEALARADWSFDQHCDRALRSTREDGRQAARGGTDPDDPLARLELVHPPMQPIVVLGQSTNRGDERHRRDDLIETHRVDEEIESAELQSAGSTLDIVGRHDRNDTAVATRGAELLQEVQTGHLRQLVRNEDHVRRIRNDRSQRFFRIANPGQLPRQTVQTVHEHFGKDVRVIHDQNVPRDKVQLFRRDLFLCHSHPPS